MEDANGGLSVPKGSIPTIGKKNKTTDDNEDKEWEVLDRKALGTIRVSLAYFVAFNISKEKTTEGVRSALGKLYEKPSASNKVFLMKCLFNMKMSEGGYVADHLNDFNTLTS